MTAIGRERTFIGSCTGRSKTPPPENFDENREWTEETAARSRSAPEVLPPHVVASLVRRSGGRSAGNNKESVTLRLDKDVLDHFRADCPGWHTRINEAVRKAASL
jgi:uncharacterized protein (DUF4415 family)